MNLKNAEIFKITGEKALLAKCPRDVLSGSITGISTDSRKIKKGELFVALKGDNFDGNDFICDVLNKGAIGAIVSKEKSKITLRNSGNFQNQALEIFSRFQRENKKLKIYKPFIIQVPNTLETLGDIAQYYRGKFNIPLIAITGSCGKTTTKEIAAALLCSRYEILKTEGNYNNLIGLPFTIFNIKKKHDAVVAELGMSHAGEIKRLAEIARTDIAVITNVGKAHLGFFDSLDDIAKAKAEILEIYPPPKICVLNRDDNFFHYFVSKTKAEIITFGINKKSDFRAEKITFDSLGRTSFYLNGKTKVKTSLWGMGNVYNVLASFAIASSMGVGVKQAVSALSEIKPSSGRANFYKAKGFCVLDDSYNANPSSLVNLLQAIEKITIQGKKILLLGEMLELGKTARKEHIIAGKLISDSSIDVLITVGQETKFTAENIFGDKKVWHFDRKDKAKRKLVSLLNKGDLLAVKGSRAMGMEEIIPDGLKNLNAC